MQSQNDCITMHGNGKIGNQSMLTRQSETNPLLQIVFFQKDNFDQLQWRLQVHIPYAETKVSLDRPVEHLDVFLCVQYHLKYVLSLQHLCFVIGTIVSNATELQNQYYFCIKSDLLSLSLKVTE